MDDSLVYTCVRNSPSTGLYDMLYVAFTALVDNFPSKCGSLPPYSER